jgi:DNA-binding CsgD family transcriptional regulator
LTAKLFKKGAAILRKTKKFQQLFGESKDSIQEQTLLQGAEKLVFCHKNNGTPRFQVEMSGDREAALSRAASLLALGCMASGESPGDYAVLVPADNSLIDRIAKHAEELLHVGRSFSAGVELSPREHEVLKELLNHRVNKEIADSLCISVRTVKFHVSSLLAKFGVGSRWDLIQKARDMFCTKQVAESFAKVQSDAAPNATPPAPRNSSQQETNAARESKGRKHQGHQNRVVPFRSGQLRTA